MRMDIISDIHLEFFEDSGDDFVHTWTPDGEVLILAGDVGGFRHWWQRKSYLIDVLCAKYSQVLFVAGNHDYYGTTLEGGDVRFREIEARIPNFHFLERNLLEIDGVKFAGCSLWFKEDPMSWRYEAYLNDFAQIQELKPAVYERNLLSQAFLGNLQEIDVVITHHMFSTLSVHERYAGDPCNRFFLCELGDTVAEIGAKFAIHGHTHVPCDYMLGNTRVICHPHGYPGENDFGKEGYRPVTIEV